MLLLTLWLLAYLEKGAGQHFKGERYRKWKTVRSCKSWEVSGLSFTFCFFPPQNVDGLLFLGMPKVINRKVTCFMLCSTEGLGRPVRGKKSICSPIYKPVKFFMAERKWPSKSRKLPNTIAFSWFSKRKKSCLLRQKLDIGTFYYLPFHQPNEALLMNMLLFFSFVL